MMNAEISEIRTFHYEIVRHDFRQQINYDIQIPLPENCSHRDYFGHLIAQQKIPIFAYKEIGIALKKFIHKESSKLTAEFVEKLMQEKLAEFNDASKRSNEICNNSAIFTPEFANSKEKVQNFEDQFQQIMRQCSSTQLMHLIGEEAAMNEEIRMLIQARDFELDRLEKACESALNASIQNQGELMNGGGKENNKQISLLNNEIRQTQLDYSRQIEALLARQRRDYRELVRKMLKNEQIVGPKLSTMNRSATSTFGQSFNEKMKINGNDSKSKIKKSVSCDEKMNGSKHNGKKETQSPNCSESFSIYIGSQLKTMHNARILACQNFTRDLCLSQTTDEEHRGTNDDLLDGSKRLHLLMNIYGRELSAVVLSVGRNPRWHIKKRTEFARLCELSAELHFDSLEAQLEKIAQNIQEANKNRRRKREMADLSQLSYSPSMDFYEFDEEMLQPGDVYLTRHSNLSAVQLVFHLVGDSALSEEEITSRHPCICGLRNIVRLCAKSAIRNISFPLLMVDKFNEELMTQNWCQSRAELIFKCLKGFLMEVCSSNSGAGGALGGCATASNSLRFNINFALPSSIPRNLFHQIVDLFMSIYYLVPSMNA